MFIYIISINKEECILKEDHILNILFWIFSVIILCFFTKIAIDELMYLEIEKENREVIEEFNNTYGRY